MRADIKTSQFAFCGKHIRFGVICFAVGGGDL